MKYNYDSGADPEPGDPLLCMMNEELQKVRNNEEWRREYMTLFLRDQENIEKGRQEGRREGRKEGRKEGRQESMRDTALRMLQAGNYAMDEIANISGLSLDEVEKLRNGQTA